MSLLDAFADVTDPRHPDMISHRLLDIIAIALCAVMAGADTWVDVETFGHAKASWLHTWLELPHGIPSHDTFGRLFAQLDPAELERSFQRWVTLIQDRLPVPAPGEMRVRAIDGKQSRRSHDRLHAQPALTLVSVWASEMQLVVAQQAVDTTSNEITAIPLLLDMLDVTGCLITIDAMGCQSAIAEQILDQGAQYILALKANHGTLLTDVTASFADLPHDPEVQHTQDEQISQGHGRLERRHATVITDPQVLAWIQAEHHWPGLAALAQIEAERRLPDGTHETQTRYYVLSLPLPASQCNRAVRTHWGIENQVHWILDMAFGDDQSRVRVGHGAQNFALLRRIALNVITHDHTKKGGVKARRLQAGWDLAYLLHLLMGLGALPS
jgi:predicted transposase YbfD/YdcC